MAQRNFSNSSVETQLVTPVDDVAGTIVVTSVSGWPSAPFTVILDPDQPEEEACLVTFISGLTLTVTRGYDGTVALPHAAGAAVKHAAVAADFREANAHVNATNFVHGVDGDIVGTTDTQTLTNKAISGSNNTITDIDQSSVTGLDDSFALKADLASPTFTGTVSLPATTSIGPVSATEIGYMDGVNANVQTQFENLGALVNTKAPSNSPTFTGSVTLPSSTSIGSISAGEIAALDGVIGNIQSQITYLQNQVNSIILSGAIIPPGGLTGYFLGKRSDADYDFEWVPSSIVASGPAGDAIAIVGTPYPTGGIVTSYTDGVTGKQYRIHTFLNTGAPGSTGATDNFINSTGFIGQLLVVGAGGGGGGSGLTTPGGGGGAGAVWYGDYAFGAGTHFVSVGAGGIGSPAATDGFAGAASRFDDLIAYGGGRGGRGGGTGTFNQGGSGGSGGGGGGNTSATGGLATGGSLDGGTTSTLVGFLCSDGSGRNGGSAGPAGAIDITGSTVTYGVGGSVGSINNVNGAAGTSHRGNGGGGGDTSSRSGGAGGSGIVVVRYRIA